jgi:M6 family metalloprotease-like protein
LDWIRDCFQLEINARLYPLFFQIMKKLKTFWPLHLLVLLAGCMGVANAAPYPPEGRVTEWTQPNGKVVKLRVYGDEYYARTETPAGYTLVFDNASRTYFYANRAADGKSFVSTGIPADQPTPGGLDQHIELPVTTIREFASSARTKYSQERDERWKARVNAVRTLNNAENGSLFRNKSAASNAKALGAPVLGDKRGLTILIQFPDDPATGGADPIKFPTDREKIVRFCNSEGYKENGNTGSVRDYFYDQSLGRMTYTQTVTPIVTVPNPRNYYNFSDYPNNNTLANPEDGAREMINDAIAILKSKNFDFSALTVDENNRAIATNVFFAGADSGVFARGLWPHSFFVTPDISVGSGGKTIFLHSYQITNIPNAAPVIGTFCHENGHLLLGYPDIYSVFNGEGVGEHCLMGSGNYLDDGKTPSPLNGYFKNIVGWGKVTSISPSTFLTASLPTTGNVAYQINNPSVSTEFFMVENRGTGDKWAKDSDDTGILIWHIDETEDGNVRINNHYGVSLEQADGKNDLEFGRNRGDSGDLFDLANPKFTDRTTPNARWWNDQRSSVEVEVLSGLGRNTEVAFGGIPPNTIILDSPNGSEIVFKGSDYPIAWRSNIKGDVRIDLYRNGQYYQNIAINLTNSGSYSWKVSSKLPASSGYTIKISSLTNPVPTSDESEGTFAITNYTFPEDNKVPYGWFMPSSAQQKWKVSKSVKFEGKASLMAESPKDAQTSAIAYRSKFEEGSVSFYVKVSSEGGFDFTRFYIDGVAQSYDVSKTGAGLSGNKDWQFFRFAVKAGSHTLMWTYEKDDSYASLQDTAWIDGVSLPPGTQEIVVQQPKGNNLIDGNDLTDFGNVIVGASSKSESFKIINKGKSTLTGLRTTMTGSNSSEFKVKGFNKTILEPGRSMTFTVTFSPKAYGGRRASLHIFSNDLNEAKFDISMAGNGLGQPLISVSQPKDNPLKSGDSKNFGIAFVGATGSTKTFTITNNGEAVLKNLRVDKNGKNKGDFQVGPLGVIALDPGDSTTFKVEFTPKGRDLRSAVLVIKSNSVTGNFEVNVIGKGTPGKSFALGSSSATNIVDAVLGTASGASNLLSSSTGMEIIDGQKYLTLTVGKPAGVGLVEVSSNLLDWYSGSKYTTILIDDVTTLKVRDNTPVTLESKRYIRLK